MAFKDYFTNPASNTTLGDGTFIGPNMLRNKVRPALQQIAADGRNLYDEVVSLTSVPISVTSRTALATVPAQPGMVRQLTGGYRDGTFIFSNINLTAEVASDPLQGVYVAPLTDPTGATGAWYRERANPIDPRWFGMATSDQTVALGALQAAVNFASDTGIPLLIPRDTTIPLRVNGTVSVPAGGISTEGGGIIYSTVDLPLFKFVGAMFHQTVGEFEVAFELGVGVKPTAACAIELASTVGTSLIERNTFENIHTIGAIATIRSTSATYATSFGAESSVNWNVFNNISNIDRFGGEARNVIWFETGSGTGNTFSALMGQLGATASAFVRMDGVGCVVGDIIISGAHTSAGIGGVIDCAVLEVGPSTVYRSNMQVVGCQSDSRVARVFRLSSVGGVLYHNICHDGSLVGGDTVLGIDVPIETMRITDRDGGLWQGGKTWTSSTTGSQSVAVCKVTLSPFGSVRLTLTTTGIVDGVSTGCGKADISLRSDGTTTTASLVSNAVDPPDLFGVSFVGAGLAVTISIVFAPTATASGGHVTWEVVGNKFFLERVA